MRLRGVAVGVSAVCLLAGCTSRDVSTPVPTEAAAPYLCDGVPARGVALLTGASAPKVEQTGGWGRKDRGFYCFVTVEQDAGLFRGLTVIDQRVGATIYGSAEAAQAELRATTGRLITASAPGVGAVYGSRKGDLTAAWSCGDRYLEVMAKGVFDDGRGAEQDLSNLVVSMLPWVCGGEKAPARTVGK